MGLDPTVIPKFSQCLSNEKLKEKVAIYAEILEVVTFFINKFLPSVKGSPFLVAVTDDKGYFLKIDGDPTMENTLNQLGIKEGVRFIEEEAGANSVSLALRYDEPIQLIGEEHYHHFLHQAACYSVPLRGNDNKKTIGTLSVLTFIPFDNTLFLLMLRTIVDSIERELLVREKNKQLNMLNQVFLQTSYQAIIVTNIEGDIIELNENGKQFLRMISSEKRAFEGSSIFLVEEIGPYFKKVLVNPKEYIGIEITMSIDGSLRYFILDVIPVFDNRSSLIGIVGNLRDISEMKKTEELLRNSEKLSVVGQMAVGVAHEIRNPLTTIKGLLQLTKVQFNSEYYKLLMSEIDRMNFIVSEFLVLGKPHTVKYREEDCFLILDHILQIFEAQAVMNGISIFKDIKQYGFIFCDSNQIKQVFMNLFKNAMEAMPYGGHITIEVDIQGSEQMIRIKDNGKGMSKEVLSKIGQPFNTTKDYGNGLGIMVTKRIIDSHNGRIQFASSSESGTTVDIRLPLLKR
jgi:signal transduction histidine kinase